MTYFCSQCGWHPCRCEDWRALERQRPNKRAVSWVCHHLEHDPIKKPGPSSGSQQRHRHRFEINNERHRPYLDTKPAVGVRWDGAA